MTADGAGRPVGAQDDPPGWLLALAQSAARMPVPEALRTPAGEGRPAAVLILFGAGPDGPDLLLVQRSRSLRRHPGQAAFPGGAIDAADAGPVDAALREAAEETGVDPSGVQVLGVLPELFIWRSGFAVTPVLAWWRRPAPVVPGDLAEIAAATRIPLADLADPANRLTYRHPSGHQGPAFRAGGMLVWGFTALIIDRLLALGGWERPWDSGRLVDLTADAPAVSWGGPEPGGRQRSLSGP